MKCSDCQDLLSEYIDNELHELKQTQMRMHMEKCKECNTVYEDLTQIVSVSRALPALAPQNELWGRIEAEIRELTRPVEQEKARAKSASADENNPGVWKRFWNSRLSLSISMPQLAAGTLGVLGILALAVTVSYHPELTQFRAQDSILNSTGSVVAKPVDNLMNPEEAELNAAINRHNQAVEKRRAKWDPQMQQLFDRNLAIVNRSLEECQQLVQRNPNDQVCHEIMIMAYKEKLRLLEQFSSL
jgi:hypothetical protein